MLLIPFVSSFMVAVFIMGFNMAVIATAVLIVYYAGHPLANFVQHIQLEQQQLDAFLLLFYAGAIAVLVLKMESATNDFDDILRKISQHLSSKDERIQELELELKKRVVDIGPPLCSSPSLSTTHHRICAPALFERE